MTSFAREGSDRAEQRGFTLLEILVVVILVAVLFILVMGRLLPLRGAAEAVAVQHNIALMRRGLGQELALRAVREEQGDWYTLHRSNPMELLGSPPDNYLGERVSPNPDEVERGHWYFDRASGELIYIVRWPQYFETELEGRPRLRYRIEVSEKAAGWISDVRLHSPDRHRWDSIEMPDFLRGE